MADRSARRSVWGVVLALVSGAALVWLSSRATWSAEVVDGGVRGAVESTRSGAEHAPALVPLALLALAGVAGLIATGGWPRRVLCGVLALAGIALVAVAVGGLAELGIGTAGPWEALVGGLLILAGAVAGFASARALPRLGARYDNPRAPRRAEDDPAELWNTLSEGRDPTTGG